MFNLKSYFGLIYSWHILKIKVFYLINNLCFRFFFFFPFFVQYFLSISQQKRLQKELLALQNDPPPGMTLNEKSVQNTITQ